MRKMAFIILIALLGIDYGADTYAAPPIRPGDEIFISRRHKGDVPIGDVFSEWRYIPLEKTDKSVVMDASRTKRVLTSKEGLIYVLDRDKVMRFRPDGHLDHVYSKETVSEPFQYLSNLTLWDNGDITLLDVGSRSLLTYTKAGRFISRVSFPDWNARCVIALDDSLMLLNITNERIGQYTYHIFNKYTGKEMKAFGQVQRVNQMSFWLKEFLYRYDGKILWHGFQTMNIYEVKRDTAVVRYTINVDNRTPPRDFWWKAEGKDGFQLTIDYMDKNYIGHIPFYVESDESILLYFDGGKDKNKDYAFIDKVTRETKVIERFVFDDGLAYDPEVLYSIADGWCAILIYPEHMRRNAAFMKRFPGLGKESNPVLFLGRIK